MAIYKVGDVVVDNGFILKYTDEFAALRTESSYEIGPSGDLGKTQDGDNKLAENIANYIANSAGAISPRSEQTIGTDGKVTFTGLPVGLYLLVQTSSGDPGAYQINKPFLVTVPLDDGKGGYIYDVDATPKPLAASNVQPAAISPSIKKTFLNSNANRTFMFRIKRLDSNYPLPVNSTGYVTDGGNVCSISDNEMIVQRSGAGDLELGKINFTKAGDYYYEVSEIRGDSDIIYDNTVYWVKYELTSDGKALTISRVLIKKDGAEGFVFYDGSAAKAPALTFINTYEPEGDGDTPDIYNGSDPPGGDSPGGGGPGETTPPSETTPPGETTPPSETTPPGENPPGDNPPGDNPPGDTPGEPGGNDGDVLGADRNKQGDVLGADRNKPKVEGVSRLPKTGQLWWPVPMLLVGGVGLTGLGISKKDKSEDEQEDE